MAIATELTDATAPAAPRAGGSLDILIEKNVPVPMRDGVTLMADVYRPAGEGRHPAVLQRLPYNKERYRVRNMSIDILELVQGGYAVVHQDTRGCGASGGTFRPFLDDGRDGADTVAWAAAQPWSSGEVGMVGISYYAGTQWLAAMETPPALKAIAPHSIFHDPYHGWRYQGGCFTLGASLKWSLLSIREGLHEGVEELVGQGDRFDELIWQMPLSDFPLLRKVAPFYFEWLEHPSYDDYWRSFSPIEHLEQIVAPALITTGWYDTMLGSSLELYKGMKAQGGSERARRPQLIIGPWWHGMWGADFPERSFGERADKDVFGLTRRTARWFDYHLKGIENGLAEDKPVQIFVMGPNVWRSEDDWPLPDTQYRRYYLHSGGRANTAHGDGALSSDPPGDEHEDVYLYNPLDPVRTLGGQAGLPPATMPQNTGPKDQRPLSGRADILSYSTPPLERDVEVTGPVELILFIASSAPDTDFTGKLVDVRPDGRAEIVTDGILRVRYRESFSTPSPMEPGRIYELRIDMWATSTVFAAGHRIRLDVASSNFPRFDRNTNTGRTIADDREQDVQVAVNRVFHDRDHHSHLVLPIIERA